MRWNKLTRCLKLIAGLLLLGGSPSACVSAKINVVDERTALENQILGSYQELDNELLLTASVRSMDPGSTRASLPRFSQIREQAIRGRQSQQFYQDDIDELKQQGCLGEGSDGLLHQRPCDKEGDSETLQRLQRVMEAENAARKAIIRFIVATSPDLTQKDAPQVEIAYARLQQELAKAGHWVQTIQGEWKRK